MEKNIYDYLTGFEETQGDMWSRLETTPYRDIFEPLKFEYADNNELFNKVLFYILHAYTPNSRYTFLQFDWLALKANVAEAVGIEVGTSLYNETVHLESKVILKVAHAFLFKLGALEWKHLMMLKDLYEEMTMSAVSSIKKSSDEIDYDQKQKNSKYAAELFEEIKVWENKIMSLDTSITREMREEAKVKIIQKSLDMEDNLGGTQ